jgi:hypothetical protein
MGRRGPSSFKRLDIERAIRSAREAGLEPQMIEIETGGSIIRVFGPGAAAETTADTAAWDQETARLKAKAPKGR